jgi:hypothetical protein
MQMLRELGTDPWSQLMAKAPTIIRERATIVIFMFLLNYIPISTV